MPLPRVRITAEEPGDDPVITVNGNELPAVTGFYLRLAEGSVPVVGVEFRAGSVTADLPAGVSVAVAGPTASDFAERIDPEQFEADILAALEEEGLAGSTGSAARRVLISYAEDFAS